MSMSSRTAKEITTKALKLPRSLKHLETASVSDKRFAFDEKFDEQYSQQVLHDSITNVGTVLEAVEEEPVELDPVVFSPVAADDEVNDGTNEDNTTQHPPIQAHLLSQSSPTNSEDYKGIIYGSHSIASTAISRNEFHSTGNTRSSENQLQLLDTTGRDITRRSPLSISAGMETDHTRKVINAIYEESNTMASQTNAEICRRPTGGRIGYPTVPEGRYYPDFGDTEHGLLVELLHDSGTYKTSSDSRLYNAKSVSTSTTFQNGRGSGTKGDHRTERLYLQGGFEGCLRGDTGSSRFTKIFDVHEQTVAMIKFSR
ncbi:hypothetical protein HPULCUR_009833 [Helicostylum pulchrum]|uniref:Uncharacterized protein n=1 Tax=Helicostylum pulchrum TaxID=562976 RepID=A0ABP9YBK9_9FUNG